LGLQSAPADVLMSAVLCCVCLEYD